MSCELLDDSHFTAIAIGIIPKLGRGVTMAYVGQFGQTMFDANIRAYTDNYGEEVAKKDIGCFTTFNVDSLVKPPSDIALFKLIESLEYQCASMFDWELSQHQTLFRLWHTIVLMDLVLAGVVAMNTQAEMEKAIHELPEYKSADWTM